MKWMLSLAGLVLAFSLQSAAQDVTFGKTRYSSAKLPHEIDVNLTLTDSGILIRSKKVSKNVPAVDTEIPYSSIDNLAYQFVAHRRGGDARGSGVLPVDAVVLILLTTKSKSYWLAIEHHDAVAQQLTLLRLDKSEQAKVIEKLEAKSGKKVRTVEFKTSPLFNPTVGSRDRDEVIAFGMDNIVAALKPAMESVGCKVTEVSATRVRCKRSRGKSEQTGNGGESITATLESAGEQTRVRIRTGLGFYGSPKKKNWSTPVYEEMMRRLQNE